MVNWPYTVHLGYTPQHPNALRRCLDHPDTCTWWIKMVKGQFSPVPLVKLEQRDNRNNPGSSAGVFGCLINHLAFIAMDSRILWTKLPSKTKRLVTSQSERNSFYPESLSGIQLFFGFWRQHYIVGLLWPEAFFSQDKIQQYHQASTMHVKELGRSVAINPSIPRRWFKFSKKISAKPLETT